MLPKARRLRKTADFTAMRREGRSWADDLTVVVARRNGLGVSRVGLSVGKRVGNAVVRNRTKRKLREAVRLTDVFEGWDLLIIARKDAPAAKLRSLSRSVTTLFRRAGVLRREERSPSEQAEALP
jgi:ribonuclease P protein component